MNTAEVAIEHVLTGLLALCAFLLPLIVWYRITETHMRYIKRKLSERSKV